MARSEKKLLLQYKCREGNVELDNVQIQIDISVCRGEGSRTRSLQSGVEGKVWDTSPASIRTGHAGPVRIDGPFPQAQKIPRQRHDHASRQDVFSTACI